MEKNAKWIVDSSASVHMTGNANLFHTYIPCAENSTVRIADGSLSKVTGIGSDITDNTILSFVLLVPNLTCNLLSISKLTKDLKCVTNFFPNHCEIPNLESGRMMSNAKECAGLNLLKDPNHPKEQAQVASSISIFGFQNVSNNNSAIMLWHYIDWIIPISSI